MNNDTKRRWHGAFFTPTHWVNEAHKMIDEQLGPNWKEEYVVWDCCCGTMNLTRDYKFNELYCSTLIADELKLGDGYNPEAVKFQYDFLSEMGLDGLPPEADGLKRAFAEGRKVLFLVNPPYGTANNAGTKEGDHKAGIATSVVHGLMKQAKIGSATQQLYAQFMYKMAELGGTVAQFSPPLFLTGGSFKKFRRFWLEKYQMSEGMLFQASEFADVSGQWGIMFSIWQQGQDDRTEWPVLLKRSSEDLEDPIETYGEKVLYNLDEKTPASKWVREEVKGMKTHDAPQIASALVVKQKGRGKSVDGHIGYMTTVANCVYKNGTDVFLTSECSSMANGLSVIPENFRKCCSLFTARKTITGKSVDGHIGYMGSNGNSVYDNATLVYLVSECSSRANGLSVIPENFRKCCSLFTARRTITGKYANWINDKDEYSAPNESHPDYEQWNNDAIVYAMLNTASNQSSLRDVEYKGKIWQIKNEWFWLSKNKMIELAEEHSNDAVYQDARADADRFVFKTLHGLLLSSDAQAVLDKATELLEKTFEFREMANDEHPEWNINTWDAGWYQVKLLLKQYLPEDLKEFQKLYKSFQDRMRTGVYEFGFLRKEG